MENPIIDIPFDEPDGSTVAYDYGPGGHHANIESGRFIPGPFGNCVYFPGEGKAEVPGSVVDFTQDFSFSVWVYVEKHDDGPRHTYAGFKFPGDNNYRAMELFTLFSFWQNLTIVQESNVASVYLDGTRVGHFTLPAIMTGFTVVNDSPHQTGGWTRFDSAKLYDRAISVDEIETIITETIQPVNVHINGTNFKDYGVVIESLEGLLNVPGRKDPLTFNWEDYHGEAVDLVTPKYQVRDIEIKCSMKATSKAQLIERWVTFKNAFDLPGTQRLRVDAGTYPLFFEVYLRDELELRNKWRDQGPYFGRFTLRLREPDPVKRVLFVNGSSVSITLTCPKILTVTWGDGTGVTDVAGTGVPLSKTYGAPGEYYVVISGNIEEITAFSTSAVVVYSKI